MKSNGQCSAALMHTLELDFTGYFVPLAFFRQSVLATHALRHCQLADIVGYKWYFLHSPRFSNSSLAEALDLLTVRTETCLHLKFTVNNCMITEFPVTEKTQSDRQR